VKITDNNNICGYCNTADDGEFCFETQSIYGNKYEIRKCAHCKAYYLSPHPDEDVLKKAYDVSYYGFQKNKFGEGIIEKAIDYLRYLKAKRINKYLKHQSTILDIGCGNGKFLGYMNKLGKHNIYGIEPGEISYKRASKIENINIKKGYLDENDFGDNFFDAIFLFHVFEHLDNPEIMLDVIGKILKPNAILVFSFPNIISWQAKFFKGKWLHLDPPRHLFFFPPEVFVSLMKSKGYMPVKIKYMCIEQNPYASIQSILNIICKKREVLYEYFKGNKEYVKDISRISILLQKIFFVLSFPFFIITDFLASLFHASASVEFIFKKNNFPNSID